MHDAMPMRILERLGDLDAVPEYLSQWETTSR
jgi:hypothetical protein